MPDTNPAHFSVSEPDPAYADLSYRDSFWPSRKYEDRCDRMALEAFLPKTGDRLIEVGAGFGRLADEYIGYREVVLLDLSAVQLAAARERLGDDPRYITVQGSAFHLPFPDASFDAVVCVRVIHHLDDPGPAIAEMARVLRPNGVLVLESSNKRNLKSIALYALRRQRQSPFGPGSQIPEDVSFMPRGTRKNTAAAAPPSDRPWSASTDVDHAPSDLRHWVEAAGLRIEATRSVSLFRTPTLTRHVPLRLLTALERPFQALVAPLTPGPSIVVRAIRNG
ncbi:MAG: class I SAM-dependent methyltransferase [Candidatus Limnocylindrales bacterium]|jgi:SAM-dependent methyltransferase